MKAARCADDTPPEQVSLQLIEPLQKIRVVEPADAGAIALHQTGPVQDESTGANADEWHPDRRGALEKVDRVGMQVLDLVDQAADHHEVIEARGVAEALVRLDGDAAA